MVSQNYIFFGNQIIINKKNIIKNKLLLYLIKKKKLLKCRQPSFLRFAVNKHCHYTNSKYLWFSIYYKWKEDDPWTSISRYFTQFFFPGGKYNIALFSFKYAPRSQQICISILSTIEKKSYIFIGPFLWPIKTQINKNDHLWYSERNHLVRCGNHTTFTRSTLCKKRYLHI